MIFSLYQKNQSPGINQNADNLKEVFQAVSLDKTMADEQISDYCTYIDVGLIETIHILDGTAKHGSSWYFHLKTPFNKSIQKSATNFLEMQFLLNTGTTIKVLNSLHGMQSDFTYTNPITNRKKTLEQN